MRSSDPQALLQELTVRLLDRMDDLANEMTDLIRREIEIYREDVIVSRDDLLTLGRENAQRVLTQLASPRGSTALDLASAERTGRERAQQAAPLPEVIRAFRIGFAFLWDRLLTEAREAGSAYTEALLSAASRFWSINDEHSTAVTEAYRTEMAARTVARDRRRSALVAALTTGEYHGEQTAWEIAKTLEMPFEGSFLVVVAETGDIGDQSTPGLEDRLHRLGVKTAWRVQPGREVGILSLPRRRPVADVLAVIEHSARMRTGVSPEFHSIDLAQRATRNAHIALESLPVGSAQVKQLGDSPLAELVVGNLDATRHFVQRVLGRVLALPDGDRSVQLATAEAWLEARGSASEAGAALYCHENTVRYRIHRLEERVGGTLDDPVKLGELATALEALRVFPELARPSSSRDARHETGGNE